MASTKTWYYDTNAERYGYELSRDNGNVTLVYQGDEESSAVTVSATVLTPAGPVIGWFQNEGASSDVMELVWDAVARAGISVLYEKKSATSAAVREFVIIDGIYTLFAKPYLNWVQILPNSSFTVGAVPREWLVASDYEAAVNKTVQTQILYQIYNLLMRKGVKFSLQDMMKEFVALTLSNIMSRRNAVTGANYRAS